MRHSLASLSKKMSEAARERHRKRALTRRAKEKQPQPFKWPSGKKVADWIGPALDSVWPFVFTPWKFQSLEKIKNPIRTKNLRRRIAIAKVSQVMIHCKDTLTLWVAYPNPKNKDEFIGRGVKYLVKQTRLSLSTVQGALKDMRDEHLIETCRRHRRLPDGGAAPTTAIRLVRVKLFEVFGIAHLMNEARKEAANKLIDEITPLIESGKSIARCLLKRFEVAQSILLNPALEVSPTSALLP